MTWENVKANAELVRPIWEAEGAMGWTARRAFGKHLDDFAPGKTRKSEQVDALIDKISSEEAKRVASEAVGLNKRAFFDHLVRCWEEEQQMLSAAVPTPSVPVEEVEPKNEAVDAMDLDGPVDPDAERMQKAFDFLNKIQRDIKGE